MIGGYAGGAVAHAGLGVIIPGGWTKTLIFIVLSPTIGLVLGFAFMTAIYWIFRYGAPSRVDRLFRRLQLVSAALYSLGHGANDAQKTMGIIAGVLFAAGYIHTFHIPFWVVLAAHASIALGTLSGGWRIIHTMGSKITRLQPVGGFAAETAGAVSLFTATALGVPVSTTHTITGAIVGVGSTRRLSAVRWGIAGRIVWAWILTIPASAAISSATYWIAVATAQRVVAAPARACSFGRSSASGSRTVNTAPLSGPFSAGHRSAEQPDQVLHDRQADARAAWVTRARLLHAIEALEHAAEIARRYAGPGVDHAKDASPPSRNASMRTGAPSGE